MKLTEKQKRFVDYYVETGNATEAARRAGYSEKYINTNASKLLQNTTIKAAIGDRLKELESKRIASAEEVLQFLTSTLRGELKDENVVVEGVGDGISRARTMIKKAWRKVFDNLDKSQQKALIRSIDHLDFEIVPNDKAHKVKQRMMDFESTMVIKTDDWLDWLEMAIPLSCAVCNHNDEYEKCRIRKLLQKYNTPVINTSAKDSCEYNYKDAGYDVDKLLDATIDATQEKE